MEITNLVWHDIEVTHKTKSKSFKQKDYIDFAHIHLKSNTVSITGYDKYGDYIGVNWVYGNPKLIELTPWGCEFEAEWWGSSYYVDKQGKQRSKKMPNHKVRITAKF